MKSLRLICFILLLATGPAWAQDSNSWDWKITPYLWTVGIDGDLTVGDVDVPLDVSFGDILEDFDLGGSIYGEIGKGHHALHFDYTYLRLKPDPTPLPPVFPDGSTVATKMTMNIFEPAYNYRFEAGANSSVSLVLGARYYDIELRVTPDVQTPDLLPEPPIPLEPFTVGPSWWDYFVGFKTHSRISDKWDFDAYGTIGGGDSDLPWSFQGTFGRKFSNDNRLALGFRVWGLDYSEVDGALGQYTELDVTLYGFLIGYEFN
jgi:hypothetical protein